MTTSPPARTMEFAGTLDDQPAAQAGWTNLKILIVDDNYGTRTALAEVLSGMGATTCVAESAAEGFAAVGQFKPDLVLCDVAMPGEDGYTFIRRLRLSQGRLALVPALACTALASDEDRRRLFAAGFQMLLSKPVDLDLLTAGVTQLSGRVPPLHRWRLD